MIAKRKIRHLYQIPVNLTLERTREWTDEKN